MNGLSRLLRRSYNGLGRKVKRNAQDIRVLDIKQAVSVELVGLPPQRPTNDLLAKQLRPKGAHAQHMADSIRIPPFRKHRHRHHAANRIPQPPRLADGIHNLAQQLLVADVLSLTTVASALDNLPPKAINLVGSHIAEIPIERVARLQLLAVDQQRARPWVLIALFVKVAKQFQAPVYQRRRAIVVLAMETGDIVVHQLGGRGIIADHDEARRDVNALLLHQLKSFLIMSVQGVQRGL